ncbi:hypothetical protein [Primorskyibacter sp. S187A]
MTKHLLTPQKPQAVARTKAKTPDLPLWPVALLLITGVALLALV